MADGDEHVTVPSPSPPDRSPLLDALRTQNPELLRTDRLMRALTLPEVLTLTGRSRRTIERWIRAGLIEPISLPGDPPLRVFLERQVLTAEAAQRRAARRGRPR